MNEERTGLVEENETDLQDFRPRMPLMQAAAILGKMNAEQAAELVGMAEADLADPPDSPSRVKDCDCQQCPKCAVARMLVADQVEREHGRLADHLLQEYGRHIGEETAVEMAIRMASARQKSPGDKLIGEEIKCLDHGFVRLVDYMGSDKGIERAARLSYRGHERDRTDLETRKLLRYLLSHHHTSPFEQGILTFQCKMPIFVARQWVRHRTARLNEMSGRYSPLPEEFYVPDLEHIRPQSKTNKQGRDGEFDDPEIPKRFREVVGERAGREGFDRYKHFMGKGVANELARIGLPLSTYTEWVWQIDLNNLFKFLFLRLDSHAQYEIRVYADAMYRFAQRLFPIAMEAFDDYVKNAETFSKLEMEALRRMIPEEPLIPTDGMTDREVADFKAKLGIEP